MSRARLKSTVLRIASTTVLLHVVILTFCGQFLETNDTFPSSASHVDNQLHYQSILASSDCALETHTVNGTNFSERWPTHSPDIWKDDQPKTNFTPVWQPSNLSQICSSHGGIKTIVRLPPLYGSKDRPTGLRVVMLGDSIMRYHFLMLVHYLHTGGWVHDTMKPNIVNERTFKHMGGWSAFHRELRSYFGPDSFLCDCFRCNATDFWKVTILSLVENEHYRDRGCHDNFISFFSKFGDLGFRGYYDASDISRWFQTSTESSRTMVNISDDAYEQANFRWRYRGYGPFLRNIVGKMEPRPRFVVINEGLWTDKDLSNEASLREIRDIIRDLGMISIYKTTTKDIKEKEPGLLPHDEMCCKIFDHCLRMDWTACVDKKEYWDAVHFKAHVNLRSSEMLLDLLQDLRYGLL